MFIVTLSLDAVDRGLFLAGRSRLVTVDGGLFVSGRSRLVIKMIVPRLISFSNSLIHVGVSKVNLFALSHLAKRNPTRCKGTCGYRLQR